MISKLQLVMAKMIILSLPNGVPQFNSGPFMPQLKYF